MSIDKNEEKALILWVDRVVNVPQKLWENLQMVKNRYENGNNIIFLLPHSYLVEDQLIKSPPFLPYAFIKDVKAIWEPTFTFMKWN